MPEAATPVDPVTDAASDRDAFAPLKRRPFLITWIAMFFSNLGVWIQSVGAAWAMTTMTTAPDVVALVQTATTLPSLLFSLVGGVLADLFDRRTIQLVGHGFMLISALALSIADLMGVMSPLLLLCLTFALGLGMAIRQPAYQASVGELVPRHELPSAIALNGMNFNLARSTGPAIGGLIVAAAGVSVAFAINFLGNIGIVGVLLRSPKIERPADRPIESPGRALVSGIDYSLRTLGMRRAMIRMFGFTFFAVAPWALLPLIARNDLGGGPFTYGLLLGSLGVGAVIGATFSTRWRSRFALEGVITVSSAVFAGMILVLSFVHILWLLMPVLVIGGTAWLMVLSTFNVTVQMAAPGWVRARALSIYLTVLFGAQALGAWIWGHVAVMIGIYGSLAVCGVMLLMSLALRLLFPLIESDQWQDQPAA